MEPERRRIDTIREPTFIEELDTLPLGALRARRDLAEEVETELSYYRRILHGRMDLLAYEQRRRRGDEDRQLIDALPEILLGRDRTGAGSARHLSTDLPDLPIQGRRHLDRILGNDLMIRLPELSESDLAEASTELAELEAEISALRQEVLDVVDRLQAEVISRYKNDLGHPALRST
ncbi:MAG: RsiG family protein [Actinomycetota bacterium]